MERPRARRRIQTGVSFSKKITILWPLSRPFLFGPIIRRSKRLKHASVGQVDVPL